MDSLYVIRERMQDLYSRYSIVADKAIQFVLAVMTFYMINNNVGFMKTLASPWWHWHLRLLQLSFHRSLQ